MEALLCLCPRWQGHEAASTIGTRDCGWGGLAIEASFHIIEYIPYIPHHQREKELKVSAGFAHKQHEKLGKSVMIREDRTEPAKWRLFYQLYSSLPDILSNNSRIVCTCGRISQPFGSLYVLLGMTKEH